MNKVVLSLLAMLTILAITEGKSCGSHHSRCNERSRRNCATSSSSESLDLLGSSEEDDDSCEKNGSDDSSSSSSSSSSYSSSSEEKEPTENVIDKEIKSKETCQHLSIPSKKWKHLQNKKICDDPDKIQA